MNFIFYFLTFSLIFNTYTANTPQSPDNKNSFTQQIPTPPGVNNVITFNVPINNNNKNSSSTDATSSSQAQSASESFANNQTIIAITNDIKNKMKSMQQFMGEIPARVQPWFFNNRWRLLASGVALIYIYTWYRLLSLSFALSEPNAWHNYKSMVSFEELLQIKQDELAQEVIRAIQHRYAPQAIQEFFVPFSLFIKEIEREIDLLEQLINLCKRIRLLRISRLFPGQNSYYERAQDKLRRVLYLRNIAFSWLGSFKLEKFLQLSPEHLFSQTIKSQRHATLRKIQC